MKPLKLTMTAFGPYAKEQVIDFAELKGRNLFLITGPTGSGKTTVFDAICYAVYGKASGRDRDGESLRSHFADEHILTAVELEFELRGKKYWIRRVPKQIRRKAVGEGYTEQNAQAQFKVLEDSQDQFIDGVRAVDDRISGVIGITYEQFKQIIMIPQGEFRELLTADSTAREAILQKIFGTEAFKLVQERLGDKAREIKNQAELLQKQRENSIDNLNASGHGELAEQLLSKTYHIPSVMAAAEAALRKDEDLSASTSKEIRGLEDRISMTQKEIHTAQSNNQKLQERNQAELQFASLEKQIPSVELKNQALAKARKALTLIPLENHLERGAAYFQQKDSEVLTAEKKEKLAQASLTEAENLLRAQKDKDGERSELGERLTLFKESRKKVQDMQQKRILLNDLENKLKNVQLHKDTIGQELIGLRQQISRNQAKLEDSLEASKAYVLVCNEKEKAASLLKKTADWKSETEKLSFSRNEAAGLRSQLQTDQDVCRLKEKAYDEARVTYLSGLAGALAEKLESGKACPVCGSEHHPAPALKEAGILNEQELQDLETVCHTLRKKLDHTRILYEKAAAGLEYQEQTVQRLETELSELKQKDPACEENRQVGLETGLYELQELLTQLTRETTRLDQLIKQQPTLRNQIKEDAALLPEKEKILQQAADEEKNLYSQTEGLKGIMEALANDLPAGVRSLEELDNQMVNLQGKSDMMKKNLEQAAERWNQCREIYASAQQTAINARKNREEAQKQKEDALTVFQAALGKAGFSQEDDYFNAKMPEEQMNGTEAEIKAFYELLKSAGDYLNRLNRDTQDLVPVDIKSLEEHLQHMLQNKSCLEDQKTTIVSRMDHNRNMLEGIRKISETIRDCEETYQLVGDLAGTARGFNSQKISFERYVLAAFFNDIIAASNIRLHQMTCGRYQMNRIVEKGKGAAQSGLELEVYDFYTGKTRHVKTLSGGESFKASLALALGLADIVQACAGGVNLDTMFVDEGFGTLDPESLDHAINCLLELQQAGRLVGIISHVPELKTSIDARLEVEANKDGSRARFVIS